MIRRRRGVVVKLVGVLFVVWLFGVLYVASNIFSQSSGDSNSQIRDVQGQDLRTPLYAVLGNERELAAAARDNQLQQKFKMEQMMLQQLLNRPNASSALDLTKKIVNSEQYDPHTRSLIELGLIIPKWNVSVEIPEHPGAPGENGVAIEMDESKLSEYERKKFDQGWKDNAFNNYANEIMSLHRTLPDVRDKECSNVKYHNNLPDTSVIIIFHNEAWSALLRTVHSVLDRSPPQLIREIILVDDFSTHDHLKSRLDEYMAQLGKVRIIRSPKREGLIRARLLGSSAAVGKVLTFLDSHCECAMGWLEPLLDRIAENKSNVVAPVIDVIHDKTMLYMYGPARATNVGGFEWNLQFNWHAIPQHELQRRKSDIDPLRSPTMAGGLFAIDREYFDYIGSYDAGMDVWGGENLELSFRVWMCGGALEILPCSHVGHIFRSRSPYSWNSPNAVRKNSVRLAVVWMDEFSKYYFDKTGYNKGNYGDVSQRVKLRERLKCKSFEWYLDNVYPELFVPGESLASGEIRSKLTDSQQRAKCLDAYVDKSSASNTPPVNANRCVPGANNQLWMLTKTGEIRRDEGCIDYAGQMVMIYPCHGMLGNQEWVYGQDNTIRHAASNMCLQLSPETFVLTMNPCVGTDAQIWYWKRRTPDSLAKKSTPGSFAR